MNIQYEKARIDDMPELNKLIEKYSPKTGRRLIPADRSTIHRFFLALDENDRILGYSRILIDYFPKHLMRHEIKKPKLRFSEDVKRGEITDVFVIPDLRKRGIGSRLVETAKEILEAEHCDLIFANTHHPASKLFRKWTYEKFYPRYTAE